MLYNLVYQLPYVLIWINVPFYSLVSHFNVQIQHTKGEIFVVIT